MLQVFWPIQLSIHLFVAVFLIGIVWKRIIHIIIHYKMVRVQQSTWVFSIKISWTIFVFFLNNSWQLQFDRAYDAERGFMSNRGIMKSELNNSESFWWIYNLKNGDYYSIDIGRNTCTKTPNIAYQHCIESINIFLFRKR